MTTVEPLFHRSIINTCLCLIQKESGVVGKIDVLRFSHRRCCIVVISHGILPPIIDRATRPVIMPKLDDDKVARLDGVDECREATFIGVGSCTAAGDGVVDDGDGEVLSQVLTPTCRTKTP